MAYYISYIRVSTKSQERSGLSFDAQKAIIEHYVQIDKAEIAAEFIETESGKDVGWWERKWFFGRWLFSNLWKDMEHW